MTRVFCQKENHFESSPPSGVALTTILIIDWEVLWNNLFLNERLTVKTCSALVMITWQIVPNEKRRQTRYWRAYPSRLSWYRPVIYIYIRLYSPQCTVLLNNWCHCNQGIGEATSNMVLIISLICMSDKQTFKAHCQCGLNWIIIIKIFYARTSVWNWNNNYSRHNQNLFRDEYFWMWRTERGFPPRKTCLTTLNMLVLEAVRLIEHTLLSIYSRITVILSIT